LVILSLFGAMNHDNKRTPTTRAIIKTTCSGAMIEVNGKTSLNYE